MAVAMTYPHSLTAGLRFSLKNVKPWAQRRRQRATLTVMAISERMATTLRSQHVIGRIPRDAFTPRREHDILSVMIEDEDAVQRMAKHFR